MNQILIVDDEPQIRQLIRMHMERAGYQIIEANSGRQAIKQIQDYNIGLIILDLMMDEGTGFEVLRYLQEIKTDILVIALSARGNEEDKIVTLGLGADDYVTKPFSPLELLARVQALLRRHHPLSHQKTGTIRLNHLVLDIDNLSLHNDGKRYVLTKVECELFHFFMRNPDRVLTKREIYNHIWKHENYDDNNLWVFISRLRTILDKINASQLQIHTVRGIGYCFSGDDR